LTQQAFLEDSKGVTHCKGLLTNFFVELVDDTLDFAPMGKSTLKGPIGHVTILEIHICKF
jgi:hypothetical protein